MDMTAGIHQQHDKGYKELYSNKEVFLDLLHNILHLDWAENITAADLILVDKSYVTSDYSNIESDLVYRMKLSENGPDTIIYVLLEMQSTVDYRMPVRLLFYMVEILREYMKEAAYTASDAGIHIPAVYPIVLYNGAKPWDARLSLAELTDRSSEIGTGLLDFRYSLIDVNYHYTEEELLANDCMSAIIFLLDRKGDMREFLRRLQEIAERFHSLSEGKNREIITHWLKKTRNPIVAKDVTEILNAEEGKAKEMIDWISEAYERGMREAYERGMREAKESSLAEGIEKGIKKGRAETQSEIVRNMKAKGISDAQIADFLQIAQEDVWKFYK